MLEHGEEEGERRDHLQHVMKTDPDPRVRRRAHALLPRRLTVSGTFETPIVQPDSV